MSRTLAASFALVALLSLPMVVAIAVDPAAAQEKASTKSRLDAEFAATDANKDGVLTRAEVNARMARMKIRGGTVSPEQAQGLAALWFGKADANKDAKITRFELGKAFDATFDRYDTNHDGTISPAERRAAASANGVAPK